MENTAAPSLHRTGQRLRRLAALCIGVPSVILATGAFYSLAGIHGGHYGAMLALALAHGGLLWLVFRLGGGRRMSAAASGLLLAAVSVGPLVVGHSMGYGDLQSLAYRMVQEDTQDRYPREWKTLGREALFPRWVGQVTGREADGVAGYLRAQAAIGWEGPGRINKTMRQIERTGFWVWLAWAWHLVFFAVAGAVAYFAAVGRPAAASPSRPTSTPATPAADEEWGRAPADPPAAGTWSGCNEQQRIHVFLGYAPGADFATLDAFFTDRVARCLPPAQGTRSETDVRNYLERVCVMTPITRQQLTQLVARYAGAIPQADVPRVPDPLKSAFLCRNEPDVVEIIWETGHGYWALSWTRDAN
jgi:hypothetical protein